MNVFKNYIIVKSILRCFLLKQGIFKIPNKGVKGLWDILSGRGFELVPLTPLPCDSLSRNFRMDNPPMPRIPRSREKTLDILPKKYTVNHSLTKAKFSHEEIFSWHNNRQHGNLEKRFCSVLFCSVLFCSVLLKKSHCSKNNSFNSGRHAGRLLKKWYEIRVNNTSLS